MSSDPLPQREKSRSFVQYLAPDTLDAGAEIEEQAALFDSAPLFVPGPWNAAHNLDLPPRERALFRFPAYELTEFSANLVPDGLSFGLSPAVSKPQDLLALRYWDLFRGFGEGASSVDAQALEETGVFAEVRSLQGQVLRSVPVQLEILSMQAMQPAIYFLRVETGGRVLAMPTLSESSGDSDFDTAAKDWLGQSGLAVGLPPGLFEIRIYP